MREFIRDIFDYIYDDPFLDAIAPMIITTLITIFLVEFGGK